jgi:hypothetical protein
VGFAALAVTRSGVGAYSEPLPLKIGPERIVHMAMAATQRNSMRADSFAVGFHASEWLLSQGRGKEMKPYWFTHRTP